MADGYAVLERQFTVTIADSASLSDAVDLDGYSLTAISMPSSWTTADLTFQAAKPDATPGTYQNVYDSADNEKTVEAGASRYILLDPTDFIGIRHIKVRSGTSGTPVTQSGGTDIVLIGRPL